MAIEASIESDLAAEELHHLIRKLPLGYRTVFNLYSIEGYSHSEIGKALGIAESTSRSQLTKSRNMLRQLIHKHRL